MNKLLEDMTELELWYEVHCGLVCPFPLLEVPGAAETLLGKDGYERMLDDRKAYWKRKSDAATLLRRRGYWRTL